MRLPLPCRSAARPRPHGLRPSRGAHDRGVVLRANGLPGIATCGDSAVSGPLRLHPLPARGGWGKTDTLRPHGSVIAVRPSTRSLGSRRAVSGVWWPPVVWRKPDPCRRVGKTVEGGCLERTSTRNPLPGFRPVLPRHPRRRWRRGPCESGSFQFAALDGKAWTVSPGGGQP